MDLFFSVTRLKHGPAVRGGCDILPDMRAAIVRLTTASALLTLLALAQKIPPGMGKGWMGEFDHASSQLNALGDAIPAEKFSWRPAPGVRSVSEVYMHIAVGNYFLLGQAGVKVPPEIRITQETERIVTAKPAVLKWLKDSQELVRQSYPKLDRQKQVKFFDGENTTADGILLRLLVHNHEHMGQSIAYARSIGVKPPWSE
jgi:uncharacterized damage-inducible protein DinB